MDVTAAHREQCGAPAGTLGKIGGIPEG